MSTRTAREGNSHSMKSHFRRQHTKIKSSDCLVYTKINLAHIADLTVCSARLKQVWSTSKTVQTDMADEGPEHRWIQIWRHRLFISDFEVSDEVVGGCQNSKSWVRPQFWLRQIRLGFQKDSHTSWKFERIEFPLLWWWQATLEAMMRPFFPAACRHSHYLAIQTLHHNIRIQVSAFRPCSVHQVSSHIWLGEAPIRCIQLAYASRMSFLNPAKNDDGLAFLECFSSRKWILLLWQSVSHLRVCMIKKERIRSRKIIENIWDAKVHLIDHSVSQSSTSTDLRRAC